MNGTSNLFRRAALGLVALAANAAALSFDLILNDSQPRPNGTGLPVKWPAGTIQLRLMLGDVANLSDSSSYNQSARTAALAWNSLIGSAQFQTTNVAGSPADDNDLNELGFAAKVFGRDFDESTLAVTTGYSIGNERIESDVVFNTAFTWDSYRGNRRSGAVDIQRVTIHELGHVLGLDHPDEAGQTVDAIMNSTIGNRDSASADDTEGAQAMYGPPGVPANDNFANAATLAFSGTKSITAKGHNSNATKETGDPRQGDNPGGRSVWWKWTAPSAGNVTLETGKVTATGITDATGGKSSYFDTTLGVYTGAALGSLTKIVDNDDINPGVVQISKVTFVSTTGTEYRIMVDGYNSIEDFPTETGGADNAAITLNLIFDGDLGTAPTITTQPASATVTSGSSASFSVVATGSAPLSYQWLLGGTAISGATSSTFSITSATTAQAGTYSVTVSNAAGSVTSNNATLTVNAPPAPPPSSGGGGGGGGGAPSLWFVALLAALGLARLKRR